MAKIGNTYQADRLDKMGKTIQSALDHVYFSNKASISNIKTLDCSATDHLPVVLDCNLGKQEGESIVKFVEKRSYKHFNQSEFNSCLASKNWELLGTTEDVNQMVEIFNEFVTEALDKCAPKRRFQVRKNYIVNLSEGIKNDMKKRDQLRRMLSKQKKNGNACNEILLHQYKRLRNKITNEVEQKKKANIGMRLEMANSPTEAWRIAKSITNPRKTDQIKLVEDCEEISDDKMVAKTFNTFFVNKIKTLRQKIAQDESVDPLKILKEVSSTRNLHFELKTVSEKTVRNALSKIQNKTSCGLD